MGYSPGKLVGVGCVTLTPDDRIKSVGTFIPEAKAVDFSRFESLILKKEDELFSASEFILPAEEKRDIFTFRVVTFS